MQGGEIYKHKDAVVKIRRREQVISLQELKILLFTIIDSGYRIRIRKHRGDILNDECYVKGFTDDTFREVIMSCDIKDESVAANIPLSEIGTIEFETFFHFKGLSSKVFRIKR